LTDEHPSTIQRVRLDRWLWAARFFKTRARAKAAIEGGKVQLEPPGAPQAEAVTATGSSGRHKPKVSKEIGLGDILEIRRGRTPEVVVVTGLSERRGNATAAAALYEETAASVEAREAEKARRRMADAGLSMPRQRPDKRDRRRLAQLKHGQIEDP